MELLTVSDARKNLYKLIDDVAKTHEPAMIKGKRNSAVILSQEGCISLNPRSLIP